MIKFYKGDAAKYINRNDENNPNPNLTDDIIYFAEDSKEIFTDGESFGKNADQSRTTADIIVAGGPLANNIKESTEVWPWDEVDGNKVIPAGTSVQDILQGLFLKKINGTAVWQTATWTPSLSKPSVELRLDGVSENGPVEVGTKVTCNVTNNWTISNNTRTCVCKCTQGYFESIDGDWKSDNKSISKSGSNDSTSKSTSYEWNSEVINDFKTSTEFTVEPGTNTFKVTQSGIKVSVDAFEDITIYPSTNTKVIIKDNPAILKGDTKPSDQSLSSSNTDTIEGQRAYWMGSVSDKISDFSSDIIRSSSLTKSLGTPVNTVTAKGTHKQVIIATQKEISAINSKNQIGADVFGNFNCTELNIDGANGYESVKYYVYEWTPANPFDKDDILTITYK